MNSFYVYLFIAIITGGFLGYLSGFIRILFLFIQIVIAIIVAYFLNPAVSDIINDNTAIDTEWTQVIAFISVLITSFILLHLLIRLIAKHTAQFNKTFFNRIAGVVAGLVCGLFSFISTIQFTNITTIPTEVKAEINARGLDDVFIRYTSLVNDKFAPLFQQQPVQVMALKTIDSTSENGIKLPFVTNDFEVKTTLEASMLQLINEERKKYGLQSLVADTQLTLAARMHSSDMFRRGYFSHNTPEGINPFQRLHKLNITYLYAGENLAMAPTLLKAHEGLMRSPGHRANILNPSYGKVGIGILDAGIHGLMITQEFRD